ncbi:MAG TPA: 2-hydroxyacyl-CoA dehydratase family protein [Bacillota bacterium]|nr:2-hydroxyacyl-CoA dehydratase family protein [Bacillota bacterium]
MTPGGIKTRKSHGEIAGETRRIRIIQALSRKNWVHNVAELVINRMERQGWKPYQIDAIRCFADDFRHGYLKEKPCIFTSAFVPNELIYGLGGVPFLPEAASGFAASFGFALESLTACESLWYSPDLCSFHRAGVGASVLKLAPKPAAVVVSSQLCDGGKRSLFQISQYHDCPFYILDVPYTHSALALDRLAKQIEEAAIGLERDVPDLSRGHIDKAFANSNVARNCYLDLCKLRTNTPSPWRGSEALNYVVLFLWAWGSPWLAKFYQSLRDHAEDIIKSGDYPVPNEQFRLAWLNLRPYYSPKLFNYLEDTHQVSVAFEEFSYMYWDPLDAGDPYMSLAKKIMANPGWGPIERRLDVIDKIVREFSIDGVVQFAQWGCRQYNGAASILSDYLRKKGVPFLNLDGDGVDVRNSGEAQSITRLGAFQELLESQKIKNSR